MFLCAVLVLSLGSSLIAQDLFLSPLDEARSTLLSYSSGSSIATTSKPAAVKPAVAHGRFPKSIPPFCFFCLFDD